MNIIKTYKIVNFFLVLPFSNQNVKGVLFHFLEEVMIPELLPMSFPIIKGFTINIMSSILVMRMVLRSAGDRWPG
jgi:hypothetical protein